MESPRKVRRKIVPPLPLLEKDKDGESSHSNGRDDREKNKIVTSYGQQSHAERNEYQPYDALPPLTNNFEEQDENDTDTAAAEGKIILEKTIEAENPMKKSQNASEKKQVGKKAYSKRTELHSTSEGDQLEGHSGSREQKESKDNINEQLDQTHHTTRLQENDNPSSAVWRERCRYASEIAEKVYYSNTFRIVMLVSVIVNTVLISTCYQRTYRLILFSATLLALLVAMLPSIFSLFIFFVFLF